jgi:hypothetical protein
MISQLLKKCLYIVAQLIHKYLEDKNLTIIALQADFNAIMEWHNYSYIQRLFKLQQYNTKVARPYVLLECLNADLRDNPSPKLVKKKKKKKQNKKTV